MRWHGRMSSLAAWWILAVGVAAALEEYVDIPLGDLGDEVMYEENNLIDTGPLSRKNPKEDTDLSKIKNILLYKLLKLLRENDEEHSDPHYRENLTTTNENSHETEGRNNFKDISVKRFSNIIRGSRTIGFKSTETEIRPQQKWKIKKGKAIGSQMVCYFKLCAFRSPA